MGKYFFFGAVRPDPSGHRHITTSPDMQVMGGTKEEHDEAVEIVEKFGEAVKREGHENAAPLLRDVIKRVRGE